MQTKTVLVTGGARGIGKQICIDFANLGYNVCINYNKSVKEAKELEMALINDDFNVISYKADVSKKDEVDAMVDFVLNKFETLDAVVNNAAVAENKLFTDITEEDFDNMYNTNVKGTFNVTQAAIKKYMLNKKNGSVVNISSIWGITGASCEVNYSTSKAAIIGMTKALAKELGLSNIRVNAVAPGIIDTEMNKKLSDEDIKEFVESIPLNKIGTVEDVSNVVTFLASENSKYITGQVISPNGGVVI